MHVIVALAIVDAFAPVPHCVLVKPTPEIDLFENPDKYDVELTAAPEQLYFVPSNPFKSTIPVAPWVTDVIFPPTLEHIVQVDDDAHTELQSAPEPNVTLCISTPIDPIDLRF